MSDMSYYASQCQPPERCKSCVRLEKALAEAKVSIYHRVKSLNKCSDKWADERAELQAQIDKLKSDKESYKALIADAKLWIDDKIKRKDETDERGSLERQLAESKRANLRQRVEDIGISCKGIDRMVEIFGLQNTDFHSWMHSRVLYPTDQDVVDWLIEQGVEA